MDLVDRYLQAVKFWLPSAQKQDIIAELSEDLRSQIEDKETTLGRKVTEAEVAALLRQVGRPVVVANRYLPQRQLIGPLWFPIYVRVLKIVAAGYLVPWILVWIGLMLFDPGYRATHIGSGWLAAVGTAWSGFWTTAVVAIGTVTIVFAVLERAQTRSRFLDNWEPGKLPAGSHVAHRCSTWSPTPSSAAGGSRRCGHRSSSTNPPCASRSRPCGASSFWAS